MKNNNRELKFTEGWLSGFAQSDGSFTVVFDKRSTGLKVRPKPIFILSQHISELELFKKIQQHFGIGFVTQNKSNQSVSFFVTSLKDIEKVLLPIFDRHPLSYGKLSSYLVFKEVVQKMLNKEHLKLGGLLEIIEISYYMNKATSLRTLESKEKLLGFLKNEHGLLPNVISGLLKILPPAESM